MNSLTFHESFQKTVLNSIETIRTQHKDNQVNIDDLESFDDFIVCFDAYSSSIEDFKSGKLNDFEVIEDLHHLLSTQMLLLCYEMIESKEKILKKRELN